MFQLSHKAGLGGGGGPVLCREAGGSVQGVGVFGSAASGHGLPQLTPKGVPEAQQAHSPCPGGPKNVLRKSAQAASVADLARLPPWGQDCRLLPPLAMGTPSPGAHGASCNSPSCCENLPSLWGASMQCFGFSDEICKYCIVVLQRRRKTRRRRQVMPGATCPPPKGMVGLSLVCLL